MSDLTQTEIQGAVHNAVVGEIVKAIVKPPLESGGSCSDILVILESVVVGTMLVATKLGGDEIVLDVLVEAVKKRLAEARLGDITAAGRA